MMHLVSSAKSKTLEKDNIEGKSLTKMRKRTGPHCKNGRVAIAQGCHNRPCCGSAYVL